MQTKIGYLLCIGSLLFTISLSKDLNEGRYLNQNRFYRYANIRLTRSSLNERHKEKYLTPTRFLPVVLSKETNEEKYPNKVSTSAPTGGLISESFSLWHKPQKKKRGQITVLSIFSLGGYWIILRTVIRLLLFSEI